MKTENIFSPLSGYYILPVLLVLLAEIIWGIEQHAPLYVIPLLLVFLLVARGLMIISPNNAKVLLLFGDYKGSIKRNGLF